MIAVLGLRVAQILISAVTLALAVVLINGYGPGHAPSIIDYGSFCGAAALLFSLIGVAAVFFDAIAGIIILVLDGIATFFLLAAAAAWTAKIKTGDCTSALYWYKIRSTIAPSADKVYYVSPNKLEQAESDDWTQRCRISQAETAFSWILFILFAGALVLSFMKKSSKNGSIV